MDAKRIEKAVRELQTEIYWSRKILFPVSVPPIEALFQPDVAARILQIDYQERPQLAKFSHGNKAYETAGMLNRRDNVIYVSTKFPPPSVRFTGAHEIGHYMLHTGQAMHRDRPLFNDDSAARPIQEREADYFAACFIAPEKLVVDAFEKRFGRVPLELTETVAFHLVGQTRMHELTGPHVKLADFAASVVSVEKFGNNRFQSLANHFGLSIGAMAIRLIELKLLKLVP
jgi:hypothetical protein